MATYIRRTRIVVGSELARQFEDHSEDVLGQATLVFERAADEESGHPSDVLTLVKRAGIKSGIPRTSNPPGHDWWIPVAAIAAAGVPYAKALTLVIQTWLKEWKGRQVRLENGSLKITANTADDAIRIISAITKHEIRLGNMRVTKAQKPRAKKAAPKRSRKP